jgi:ABC-type glycerol-3-phosphate transport system permease component
MELQLSSIIATALFNFLSAWDEFMFAITIIHANELRTLPAGMFAIFIGEKQIRWGPMMAGSIFITIPVVIVFIFLQKYLVQGLTKGAIKG